MNTEPICLICNLPGDQCGCADPANVRKCEICGTEIPDDCQMCDDCVVNLMLYLEIRDRQPS